MYTQEIVCPRCGKLTQVNVPDRGNAKTPCQRMWCSAKIVVTVDDQGRVTKIVEDSACIIATACLRVAGEEDECRELAVLRGFRDWYIRERPEGRTSIAEYYAIAPVLCEQINNRPDRASIWQDILRHVRRAVDLIESGERDQAIACYQYLLDDLKARLLPAT